MALTCSLRPFRTRRIVLSKNFTPSAARRSRRRTAQICGKSSPQASFFHMPATGKPVVLTCSADPSVKSAWLFSKKAL